LLQKLFAEVATAAPLTALKVLIRT